MTELQQELVGTQLKIIKLGEELRLKGLSFTNAHARLRSLSAHEAILQNRLKKSQDTKEDTMRIELRIKQATARRSFRQIDFVKCAIAYNGARQSYLEELSKCEGIKCQLIQQTNPQR